MVEVLADPALYEFTGGESPGLDELQVRYAKQTEGHSADLSQWWLNWVVIQRKSGIPVGFVQATVENDGSALVADLAWLISPRWQGQGMASEGAEAMVTWLRSNGVHRFTAHIHPDHQASMKVARYQALRPSAAEKDGETRWEFP